MANLELKNLFQEMADVTELLGGNRFRVIAFQKAARTLDELTEEVADIPPEKLKEIDGIGKGTADRIAEFLATGHIKEHDDLLAQVPPGVVALLNVPGLGPKGVATLWKDGGITDLVTLKAKIDSEELAELPRFGKKKLETLKKNLDYVETAAQRTPIGVAMPLATWFLQQLRKIKGVREAAFAGSLRRGRETIGDIDLLVAAKAGDAAAISAAFVKLEVVVSIIGQGPTKTSIRTKQGMQVDLRIVEPSAFGAALIYFTGSKDHNVRLRERAIARGCRLNEYGLFKSEAGSASAEPASASGAGGAALGPSIAGKTEEEVYAALDLAWIPPELREDHGEIAQAEPASAGGSSGGVPTLVELPDIKAELHAHTTASDGHWSIRELAAAAADRGFHTVAITDHSRGQVQANGLSIERLEQHIQAVRDIATDMKGRINVLAGAEVDILTDGKLDYPDHVLRELDIVVASPHAALSQEPAKATKRLLKAIENRYVTILGHPTGRIVGKREGLSPDMRQIIAAAAERGIALEINANYRRLDLRDTHARAALEAGVKLAINTDAHGPADLDQLIYGVLTARRAAATADDVVNCLSAEKLRQWIASTRRA